MIRADLVFSIVLVALGVATVVESVRMPTLAHLGVHPMSAPGLTPGVVGVVIAALGLVLLLRSALALARGGGAAGEAGAFDRVTWARLALALALCLGYALGLVGRVPFLWATVLFVFVFVVAFGWRGADRRRLVVAAAALALAAGFAVTLLFERVFLVRLP